MFRRRRPLLRAAMIGGGAYYAGKRMEQGRQAEADQDARLAEVEYQQQQAAYQQQPPSPAGTGISDSTFQQLEKLGELKAQGILTQEEFDAAKQKLLQGP